MLENAKMAITAGIMVNAQVYSNLMRSGQEASSRQPLPFIRTVPSGLESQCDSMLEMREIVVCGLTYSESGNFCGFKRRSRI